jgi:putative transposase
MPYPSDLTDGQWDAVEPLLLAGADHRRGPKVRDARKRFDALMYITHTGCQWRFLPAEYGTWGSVWGSFNRWSKAGAFAPVLRGLHGQTRLLLGRAEEFPSLVIVDAQLARGATNGGGSFHGQGGPWGATKGAKRFIAVDVTGFPMAGVVVSANIAEVRGVQMLIEKLADLNAIDRLTKVRVDKGTHKASAEKLSKTLGIEVERYGWATRPKPFKPIARAWQVEAAHGMLGRSRRLAKSFEQTESSATAWLELACIHIILSDTAWTGVAPRPRTAAEQAALDARKAAGPFTPEPGDLGVFTPPVAAIDASV